MSKKVKITQLKPDSWAIENLTGAEIQALRQAIGTATLPTARNLHDLKELLDDTPISNQ